MKLPALCLMFFALNFGFSQIYDSNIPDSVFQKMMRENKVKRVFIQDPERSDGMPVTSKEFGFDKNGNRILYLSFANKLLEDKYRYEYDDQNRLVKFKSYDPYNDTSYLKYWETFTYDKSGRVIKKQCFVNSKNPVLVHTLSWKYDKDTTYCFSDNIAYQGFQPGTSVTKTYLKSPGLEISEYLSLDLKNEPDLTSVDYEKLDAQSRTVESGSIKEGKMEYNYGYSYNSKGQMARKASSGSVKKFHYDEKGLLIEVESVDAETKELFSKGSYVYDSKGLLLQVSYGKSKTNFSYTYF